MFQGRYVIVGKQGHVFGASSVEATETDFIVRLDLPSGSIETRLRPEDLALVYEVKPSRPSVRVGSGVLVALTALERLLVEVGQDRRPCRVTVFGSGPLSFTLLPDRSAGDGDALVSDAFYEGVTRRAKEAGMEIELLDENLLNLLGPWQTRATELCGPLGLALRIVHPLDTVMMKLLRCDPAHFAAKDQADINSVLTHLTPSPRTLENLLTENPLRYARLPGRFADRSAAIERNTRWFLKTWLPHLSFEDLAETAGDRVAAPLVRAGFLPAMPSLIHEAPSGRPPKPVIRTRRLTPVS